MFAGAWVVQEPQCHVAAAVARPEKVALRFERKGKVVHDGVADLYEAGMKR